MNYKDAVASLGCVVCRNLGYGPTPAALHHIRIGQGTSQRAPDELVIPLCREHHQGVTGVHADRRQFEATHGTELLLLAQTIREAWKLREMMV